MLSCKAPSSVWGSHLQSLITNKCTIFQRTIFVCVCLLFVHYTPGLFLHNMILHFSEQCPWRISHFSWAIFPMAFRRSYFYPLQSFPACSCLSLKDGNYESGKDIFSTCFTRSKPGIPSHTKNWGLEHIFSPRQFSCLTLQSVPGRLGRGGRRRELRFRLRVPSPAHLSFPRTGGCGERLPQLVSVRGSPAAQLTPSSLVTSRAVSKHRCNDCKEPWLNIRIYKRAVLFGPFLPLRCVALACGPEAIGGT